MTDKEQLIQDFYKARNEIPVNLQQKGDWVTTDTHIFRVGIKGGKPYISAVSLASHNRALKHDLHAI